MTAWVRLIGLAKLIGVYIMKRHYHEGRSLPNISDPVALAGGRSSEVMLSAPQPSRKSRVASTGPQCLLCTPMLSLRRSGSV